MLNLWKKELVIFSGLILFACVTAFVIFESGTNLSHGDSIEVHWNLLGELDYVTGKGTPNITSMDGRFVRIPGFMVPLEDNQRKVTQFLLVPSPQACIHVPPPPPNQMVLIEMEDEGVDVAFGPIWVFGKLKITSKKHMYGETSFVLEGEHIQPYKSGESNY